MIGPTITPNQLSTIQALLKEIDMPLESGFAIAVSKYADVDSLETMTTHQANWLISELTIRKQGQGARK